MAARLMQWSLGGSAVMHAALLYGPWIDEQPSRQALSDRALEVVLVNARSAAPPKQAQAVAQASLAGGGQASEGRAQSPFAWTPSSAQAAAESSASPQQLQQLQAQQQQLLLQVRQALAAPAAPDPVVTPSQNSTPWTPEQRQQLLQTLAEIERRIVQENARPRRRFISPATREEAYAMYWDALRRKIESQGTKDFPQVQGERLYGELTMNLIVDVSGRLVNAQVVSGSTSRSLDQRALEIVRSAAPFGAFSTEMSKQADELVITSRFRFTREAGLEATVQATGQR